MGSAAAAVITFAASPLLTRIFGPEVLGLFGVFSALGVIFALVATGRFDLAIPIPVKESEAAGLYRLCYRVAVVAGLGVACLLPLRAQLAHALGYPGLEPWLIALPATVVLGAWIQTETAWATRVQSFGAIAKARVVQATVTAAIQIGLSFAGWIALPAGLLAGFFAQIALMRKIRPDNDLTRLEPPSALVRKYRQFPLYTLPSGLLDAITMQLPLLVGGLFFGPAFAGFYVLSSKILALPSAFFGGPAGQVFYREFAKRLNSGGNARALIFSAWIKLAAMGAIPFLVLAYSGPWLFEHIYGDTWRAAGEMAVVLGPMFFVMLISSPTSGAMLVLGGQRVSAVFSLCFPVYRLTCLWFGYRQDNPLLGLALLALAEIITILIFNLILLRRLSVRPDEFTPEQKPLPS